MRKSDVMRLFKIEDLNDLPAAISKLLEAPIEVRNEVYNELLVLNNYDVSFDWFQNIFEGELSERSQKKQDFTPNTVARLVSLLTGNPTGVIYEPTAGNGSMIIADWWVRCKRLQPWEHFPSQHVVVCWELSNRSIPILLLNLSIRGIMGFVYHGDVLEKTIKTKYLLLNRKNDTLAFSEVIKDTNNNLTIYAK